MVEGTYIFDCEVFAHDWLFVFKEVATGEYTVIWNDNDEVLAFMELSEFFVIDKAYEGAQQAFLLALALAGVSGSSPSVME